ncbi:hypothetical protein RCH19_000375 [Flavobacterium sp. PL12]
MILIICPLLLTFLSYYFVCLESADRIKKNIFLVSFLINSFILRIVISFNLNKDYFFYYNFDIFRKPNGFLSFLLNEPYLYSLYALFKTFINSKEDVFSAMYWSNFLITTLFFIWLLYREDVEIWKKVLLFVLHYFIFGYVFLRNGPAYILFALFFYYKYRQEKFNWILLSPFMHISSFLMLVTYFHKSKSYFKFLLLGPLLLFLIYFVLKPFMSTFPEFESILSKITIYSKGIPVVGFIHVLFFLFIFILVIAGCLLYKRQMLHPIIVTTIIFYGSTFFINPIVSYRFSPYVVFALLLYPFDEIINERTILFLNRFSVLLFPIFFFTLYNTHQTKLFIDFLVK